MFAFFDQIGEILSSVVDFVVSLVENIISFFEMICTAVVFLYEIVAVLPVPVKAGALCIISISVIYLIVGRE